jgi:hypothetical protein
VLKLAGHAVQDEAAPVAGQSRAVVGALLKRRYGPAAVHITHQQYIVQHSAVCYGWKFSAGTGRAIVSALHKSRYRPAAVHSQQRNVQHSKPQTSPAVRYTVQYAVCSVFLQNTLPVAGQGKAVARTLLLEPI